MRGYEVVARYVLMALFCGGAALIAKLKVVREEGLHLVAAATHLDMG